jgi:ornithine cyclodeaminase
MNREKRQSLTRIVTLSEIEEAVASVGFAHRLIDAILDGFVSHTRGNFNAPPIQTMGAPPMAPFGPSSCGGGSGGPVGGVGENDENDDIENGGGGHNDYSAQTCVKSGYLASSPHYVVKVASGGFPFPSNTGNVQLYSQNTGALEAIFFDDGLLTELRTAAAGAVAARLLSPNLMAENDDDDDNDNYVYSCCCVGVVGTGMQARHQLRYLGYVTDCRNVRVWGRTASNVKKFVKDMSAEGWNVRAVEDVDDLLDTCGMIITTTSSREPLLGRRWLLDHDRSEDDDDERENDDNNDNDTRPRRRRRAHRRRPLHITCVGSDTTGKKELYDDFIMMADMLVADSRLQTAERGEFEDVIRHGMVGLEDVIEIGELANRVELHRGGRDIVAGDDHGDARLTIFDSSGLAVQDCVIASMVYETLRR